MNLLIDIFTIDSIMDTFNLYSLHPCLSMHHGFSLIVCIHWLSIGKEYRLFLAKCHMTSVSSQADVALSQNILVLIDTILFVRIRMFISPVVYCVILFYMIELSLVHTSTKECVHQVYEIWGGGEQLWIEILPNGTDTNKLFTCPTNWYHQRNCSLQPSRRILIESVRLSLNNGDRLFFLDLYYSMFILLNHV
jgi:hypothetical protein